MSSLLTSISSSPSHQRCRYSVRPFCWSLLIFILFACLSLALGGLRDPLVASLPRQLRRQASLLGRDSTQTECRLVRNVKDQCSFVRTNCPDHEDGFFSYLQLYYCTFVDVNPLAFTMIILWLSLLFSTIGIAASDFLCIDLSTLASVLGLSESLTGVTFLAFGNGSPDVFSTFAAMRSNSGSLAIGELLGAASFITSVVAGSMALVRPFRVARRSFIRDVGYFVIAVSFSMFFVADGRVHAWESAAMVGLYCFYVVMVVTWHWYLVRQRRAYERDVAARSHFHIPDNQELEIEEAAEDDDPGVAAGPRVLLHGASTEDFDTLERSGVPAWKEQDEDDETRNRYLAEIRDNMHVYRPHATRKRNTLNPIRPSLVGALEFQSVLSSLQKSRNNHQNLSINLDRYSDNPDPRSHPSDDRSVVSNQSMNRTPIILPPSAFTGPPQTHGPAGSGEDGGVSGDRGVSQPVNVTITRPPVGQADDTGPMPSPDQPPRNPSPAGKEAPQNPGLLAPPDTFRSPNYHAEADLPLSPLQTSPRGTTFAVHGTPSSSRESPTIPFPPFPGTPSSASSRAPSFSLPDAFSPSESLPGHGNPLEAGDRSRSMSRPLPDWFLPSPRSIIPTLFPTLQGWKSKNLLQRFLDIVAAPSVLLLTITVPVIEPAQPETASDPVPVMVTSANENGDPISPIRLPEDSPLVQALDSDFVIDQGAAGLGQHTGRPRLDSELPPTQRPLGQAPPPPKEWSRWLASLQLFAGPYFITLVGWSTTDQDLKGRNLLLPSLCSLLFSLLCLTCLIMSTRRSNPSHPPGLWRPFLALLGFVVAISWIATIATEVVSLLKTLGVIMNISDSLLGLTVFAVGNSLGDLVADITVARLGYPVMALSACLGGPMLNILLGIGLGGLYMTLNAAPEISSTAGGLYHIPISKVLAISSATLLITLIGLLVVVPLNNWKMDRKIGWGLVVLWSISTLTNVVIEVLT